MFYISNFLFSQYNSLFGIKSLSYTLHLIHKYLVLSRDFKLLSPVDEAVCIVSGPYLTHDMYKSLEQPADIHVVPSLFCLTVQYPHISFNTGMWWDKPYTI